MTLWHSDILALWPCRLVTLWLFELVALWPGFKTKVHCLCDAPKRCKGVRHKETWNERTAYGRDSQMRRRDSKWGRSTISWGSQQSFGVASSVEELCMKFRRSNITCSARLREKSYDSDDIQFFSFLWYLWGVARVSQRSTLESPSQSSKSH